MKIAFFSVAHISHGGGFERQVVRLTESLKEMGHEVVIISASAKFTYYLTMVLSFVYFVPRLSFPEIKKTQKEFEKNKKITVKEFRSISHLKSLLRTVDVVYSKNELLDITTLRFAVDKNTPPIICGMHTLLSFTIIDGIHSQIHNWLYKSRLYYFLLNIFDGFHCINNDQKKILEKNMKKKSIYYIPNFVEVPSRVIKNRGKIFTVLFVGRLSKQKGFDRFIKIIEVINKKKISNIQFVICGGGPLEKELLEIVQKYTNVDYKGSVTPDEIRKIYQISDVFSVTSCGEAFPVATMEALSYGVPVVGYAMPGMSDIILQGKNGFLVKPGNDREIIKKIIELKNMKDMKYLTMTKEAINTIKYTFSPKKLLIQYDKMFKSYESNEKGKSS